MNSKISVIVPIYNSEKYLDDCLSSIIDQSYKNLEIILINDGSTDNSYSLCESYAKKDNRIVLLTQENAGQASARNKGLNIATGEHITFIDSDDKISNDLFSKNIPLLENNKSIDVLQFPIYMKYGTDSQYIKKSKQQLITNKSDIFNGFIKDDIITWVACDKLFKRNLFEHLRFVEDMIYEDNYFIVDVLSKINNIFISNSGTYYYCHRENSTTTSSHTLKKDLDTQKVNLHVLEKLSTIKNIEKSKTIILSRIFYVYVSLNRNFKYDFKMNDLFLKQFKKTSMLQFIRSSLPVSQRIKLIYARFIRFPFLKQIL